MKYKIFLLVGCMLGSAACNDKKERDVRLPEERSHTSFDASAEVLSFMQDEGVADYVFGWSRGGYVGVFGSETGHNVKYAIDDESIGSDQIFLYGPKVSGEEITAYYPYDASLGTAAAAIPVTIPRNQSYMPAADLYEAFAACSSLVGYYDERSGGIGFGYPFGCLIVEMKLDAALVSLSLESTSLMLSGAGSVGREMRLSMSPSASNRIEFSCGAEPIPTSADDPVRLYVIMPPQVYPAGDLSVTAVLAGESGEGEETFVYRIDVPLEIERVSACRSSVLELSLNAGGLPEMNIVRGDLTIYD